MLGRRFPSVRHRNESKAVVDCSAASWRAKLRAQPGCGDLTIAVDSLKRICQRAILA